jgi:hypothetical protein
VQQRFFSLNEVQRVIRSLLVELNAHAPVQEAARLPPRASSSLWANPPPKPPRRYAPTVHFAVDWVSSFSGIRSQHCVVVRKHPSRYRFTESLNKKSAAEAALF